MCIRDRIKTERRRRPEIKRRSESQPDSSCMRAHVVTDDRRLCTKRLSSHVHPRAIPNDNQTHDSNRGHPGTSLRITRPDVTRKPPKYACISFYCPDSDDAMTQERRCQRVVDPANWHGSFRGMRVQTRHDRQTCQTFVQRTLHAQLGDLMASEKTYLSSQQSIVCTDRTQSSYHVD